MITRADITVKLGSNSPVEASLGLNGMWESSNNAVEEFLQLISPEISQSAWMPSPIPVIMADVVRFLGTDRIEVTYTETDDERVKGRIY